MADEDIYDVVIIGTGIAGASAADKLREVNPNLKVVLLEARDRIGGRMYTNQENIDLGAQWIHGACPANCLYTFVKPRNIKIEKENSSSGYFYTSQGRAFRERETEKAIEIFGKLEDEAERAFLEKDPSTTSLRDFYDMRVKEEIHMIQEDEEETFDVKDLTLLVNSLAQQMESYLGGSLYDASLYLYGSARELPGGDAYLPVGVSSIIRELFSRFDTQTDIKHKEEVTEIKWNAEMVELKTKKGSLYKAKHVICTIPVGVLQTKPHLFLPPLDDGKINAIKNMRPGRVSKIILHFSTPFWFPGEGTINFIWTNQELETSDEEDGWITSVNGMYEVNSTDLRMWVVGEAASLVDTLPDDDVIAGATKLIRKFLGNSELVGPKRITRHTWLTDPYSLGTWSYPSIHSQHQDYTDLMTPLPSAKNPRLLLAGEHTHPTYWSFMHGARLSGLEQAQKILDFIESSESR